MMKSKSNVFFVAIFFCAHLLSAQDAKDALKGQWSFALDPVDVGVAQEWFNISDFQRWDKVSMPHCFSIDARYRYYTGTAWYFKPFGNIAVPADHRAVIRFEAVFYKSEVWLNGKRVGEHEGGYTPFEIDVTQALADKNLLAVRVNNAWDTTTIPGAKTPVPYQSANMAQLVPWINYGGITRDVKFFVRPASYAKHVRVEATPDLSRKTAQLHVDVQVANLSQADIRKSSIQAFVYQSGRRIPLKFKVTGEDIVAGREAIVQFDGTVAAKDVKLWGIDDPVLYDAVVIVGKDTTKTKFGIRKIEISGTKFLLNGEPVSMGGCNRPLDYPGHGSMDPAHVLEKDLTLIKNAGMEFSRISHYPVSTELLDWADSHGMLIIGEPGNWQMTPKQLSDPVLRKKFQTQMREMIERDWNHPSVIAWSVGNEYQSQTEEGKSWTKDMYAFVKSIDPARFVTFASNIVGRSTIQSPTDEASQYVDFISANIYGNHLKTLQHIHSLYPDKPIYVSEFGMRADETGGEKARVAYLKKAMDDFRQCDFLIGASVWTFNDYQSAFPLTNVNGYRPFGLVTPERELRDMYYTWQEEFSPATVKTTPGDDGKVSIEVAARKDFPSYIMRNYELSVGGKVFEIPLLKPGETKTFSVENVDSAGDEKWVELIKPGGFVILKKTLPSR